jgi:hypothetical protein
MPFRGKRKEVGELQMHDRKVGRLWRAWRKGWKPHDGKVGSRTGAQQEDRKPFKSRTEELEALQEQKRWIRSPSGATEGLKAHQEKKALQEQNELSRKHSFFTKIIRKPFTSTTGASKALQEHNTSVRNPSGAQRKRQKPLRNTGMGWGGAQVGSRGLLEEGHDPAGDFEAHGMQLW